MNEKRNFDYKRLHPFKWYILENFPFLEDSIDVLTNYQLFCKLGEMYNKEIDAINTLGIQVEGITDWFDNLDVQEEVNNKLDEMAESGELEEIIGAYLNTKALICFDTIADMKSSENLVDGSYAKTLGYYSKNDGGMGTYKIRNITNDDVIDEGHIIELSDDNLIAELITDKVNVKQFGAKGDNLTDDLQAFQNAIDYVNENGTLYVPKGVYKISSTINTKSSISIIGEDDVPKIIFTGTGVLFNITGHPNIDYEYETKPRDTSSELKPILKQLCLTTGELHGKGKANTTAINFNTTNDTIMARGFLDNIHILHFDIGINIGKYHFYLMNFIRLNLTMNNTGIKTNNDRVDSGEKISITDGLFDTNKVGIEFTGADYDMNILNTSIDFNKCFIYASGNVVDDSRKIVIDGCHYETNDDDYVFSSDDPHGFLFGILQGTSIFITNSKFSTRSADTLFFANGRSGGTYIHFDNNRLEFKAGYYNDVQVVPYLYYFNQDENFIVTAKNNDSVVFTKPLSFRQAINSVPRNCLSLCKWNSNKKFRKFNCRFS